MTPRTDEQFASAARALAQTHIDRFARLGMSPDEIANLFGAAAAEILAQQLGPFGAIERMRDIADTCERQLLDEALKG